MYLYLLFLVCLYYVFDGNIIIKLDVMLIYFCLVLTKMQMSFSFLNVSRLCKGEYFPRLI